MKAWLLRIQTNTFINRYRRKVRERTVLEGAMATPVGEGVMSQAAMRALTEPVAAAHRSLLAQEISAALDELPDDHRLMIELADLQQLSYREIAEVVGCPIGTVMSRLHRARKSMQKRLLQQAIDLGIVQEETTAPVSLAEFKKRRQVG